MTSNETHKDYTVVAYVSPLFARAGGRTCTIMLKADNKTVLWEKETPLAKDANATSVILTLLAEALPALAPKITNPDATLTFEVYTEAIYSILKDGYVNRRYREEIKTLMGSAVNVIPNRKVKVEMLNGRSKMRSLKLLAEHETPAPETKPLVDMLLEDFFDELQDQTK